MDSNEDSIADIDIPSENEDDMVRNLTIGKVLDVFQKKKEGMS